jgi:hypothetical protein
VYSRIGFFSAEWFSFSTMTLRFPIHVKAIPQASP